jgi:hypothetical protein
MAETLIGTLALQLTATLKNSLNFSTPTDPLVYNLSQGIATGTGAGQANKLWHDTRTLAAGANESINVYSFGGAVSGVGTAFALTKVFALFIRNKANTATSLTIGGEGSANAWVSWCGGNGHTVTIPPGGCLLLIAPDATGFVVGNANNNLLKITNADGANPVTYDIIVIGAE